MSEQVPNTRDDPEMAYFVGWAIHDDFVNYVDWRRGIREFWAETLVDTIEDIASSGPPLDVEGRLRVQQKLKHRAHTALMYAELERSAHERCDWAIEQHSNMYLMFKHAGVI